MYLNTHSYYSLRYGTISPKQLLELGKVNGIQSMVISDINNTSACLEFARLAPKYDIKPIFGIDFRNGVEQLYIAIAKNNKGFQEINEYLTPFLLNKTIVENGIKEIPERAPDFENVFVVYPLKRDSSGNSLADLLPHEYIGVSPKDLDYIRIKKLDTSKMVVLQTVTFRNKRDFNAHRLLRAIDKNTLLSKLSLNEQALESHQMIPIDELINLYEAFPNIITNTHEILNQSSIHFDLSDTAPPQNQKHYTESEEADEALLMKLCKEGMQYRYPEATDEVKARVKKELDTIKKMGFVSYFLINWDIVKYARSKGYFYVGRGSGANSVVAYILRITDVDPIELDLYFERFINLYRINPPDFDIDFSWTDRDDVTAYIFDRFKHVALVATYNTFQARAVRRELGKVFGLPKEEIDKLSKDYIQKWEMNHLTHLVVKYSEYIHGFPSHLSIHASGIVISEKPISWFTPTFLPPKGYPTIQFDMHIAEDIGLYKFDILSQRGLGKIKDAIEIIKEKRPKEPFIDIHDMKRFKTDERIKTMLKNAQAIGCFYVESPAMRMLLRKLRVDNYLGLVAASSVIRPGVAQSGMMQEYILRYRNPERRKDAHPVMLQLMPETYGVMVYQEDVIKVAHFFAGLSLGEADKMRRGMSGKYRSREEFDQVRDKFFNNCINVRGHSKELTAEVWRQTASFAGYAFAKGHSASYAVESYQSLFLKAYYPLEYMVATINNYGGFYSTELYVHEARLHGGVIHPPCVNRSEYKTTLYGKDIFVGFHLLHGFEQKTAALILLARDKEGYFKSFNDFIDRVPISLEQISILIRIDAFRFTKKNKRSLLWEAHFKLGNVSKKRTDDLANFLVKDLFRIQRPEYEIPQLENSWQEDTFDQIELLGFPLHNVFEILRQDDTVYYLAEELPNHVGETVWIKGYLIHRKRTSTKNGDTMYFGTFLDEKGQWLDSVHFPQIAAKYHFRGSGVYKVKGKVIEDYDCISIEAEYMEKMEIIEDPRYSDERMGFTALSKKSKH
ncbi:DNA polymerase III subunit alpha [Paracrocinitomix mangrovi]|uniref:DNA polymerase III subunit alpha n=1 Tax=Paracrocinitomix mangrovi TaxID=2862509 RepID=UPI001C8E1B6A|nr:DNA polymerase III subunit alpha [Paracrocinitomix mangrovi]UKN00824.1 DNA polymerase III subunit alpha [Paracrocinitomix mangrovi]